MVRNVGLGFVGSVRVGSVCQSDLFVSLKHKCNNGDSGEGFCGRD